MRFLLFLASVADPRHGVTTIEIDIVSSLNVGTYTDNLIVKDSSGNVIQTIPVTLTVN